MSQRKHLDTWLQQLQLVAEREMADAGLMMSEARAVLNQDFGAMRAKVRRMTDDEVAFNLSRLPLGLSFEDGNLSSFLRAWADALRRARG